MMFSHDSKSVTMNDNQVTDDELKKARMAVDRFVSDDPNKKLEILQMLGLESYMRIIRVNRSATNIRQVMS